MTVTASYRVPDAILEKSKSSQIFFSRSQRDQLECPRVELSERISNMVESSALKKRLDSWKEIATYLNRTERTVIRWEKTRGLPVHRLPGGQAVFAYRHELDAWLKSGSAMRPIPDEEKPKDASDHDAIERPLIVGTPVPAQRRSKNRLSVGMAAVLGVGLLLTIGVVAKLLLPRRFSSSAQLVHIAQLTDDGRYKVNLRTDGKLLYFNEIEGNREILAATSITGGTIRRIYTPFSNVDLQDLSNDGKYLLGLAYVGTESERSLWYISPQGGVPGRLGNLSCHLVRKSPDNRWIACAAGTAIMMSDLDGQHAHTIASFSSAVSNLEWAPDS